MVRPTLRKSISDTYKNGTRIFMEPDMRRMFRELMNIAKCFYKCEESRNKHYGDPMLWWINTSHEDCCFHAFEIYLKKNNVIHENVEVLMKDTIGTLCMSACSQSYTTSSLTPIDHHIDEMPWDMVGMVDEYNLGIDAEMTAWAVNILLAVWDVMLQKWRTSELGKEFVSKFRTIIEQHLPASDSNLYYDMTGTLPWDCWVMFDTLTQVPESCIKQVFGNMGGYSPWKNFYTDVIKYSAKRKNGKWDHKKARQFFLRRYFDLE